MHLKGQDIHVYTCAPKCTVLAIISIGLHMQNLLQTSSKSNFLLRMPGYKEMRGVQK